MLTRPCVPSQHPSLTKTYPKKRKRITMFLTHALSIAHASVCLTDVQVSLLMLRVLIEHACRMLPANCLPICMHVPDDSMYLARAKTRDTPAPLRQAATASLIARWAAFLTHAAFTAFAASLLFEDPTHHHNLDGDPPPLSDLLAQLPPDPADPSRLPPHPP